MIGGAARPAALATDKTLLTTILKAGSKIPQGRDARIHARGLVVANRVGQIHILLHTVLADHWHLPWRCNEDPGGQGRGRGTRSE